jgi:phosphate transport system permease protein
MTQSGTHLTRRDGTEQKAAFKTSLAAKHWADRLFTGLVFLATIVGLVVLAVLLVDIARRGLPVVDWQFLTSYPSQVLPQTAGIYPALIGSLWLLGLTALFSVPLGIGAAVYLEEYAADTWPNRVIEINISNLAGVPSIIYGLLGLGIFVNLLGGLTGGESVLSGALTLSLLILPVIIIATREALRAIPDTVREGGYALGATRWEVIQSHLLPMALPGALTGTILALSRAIGETAPLIVVGAAVYVNFLPSGPRGEYTALPRQIFTWIDQAQDEFQTLAAGGIVVLMVVLLLSNSFAIALRNRYQRRI